MSVLIDKKTKIIIQGFTGKMGSFHADEMIKYGNRLFVKRKEFIEEFISLFVKYYNYILLHHLMNVSRWAFPHLLLMFPI